MWDKRKGWWKWEEWKKILAAKLGEVVVERWLDLGELRYLKVDLGVELVHLEDYKVGME